MIKNEENIQNEEKIITIWEKSAKKKKRKGNGWIGLDLIQIIIP